MCALYIIILLPVSAVRRPPHKTFVFDAKQCAVLSNCRITYAARNKTRGLRTTGKTRFTRDFRDPGRRGAVPETAGAFAVSSGYHLPNGPYAVYTARTVHGMYHAGHVRYKPRGDIVQAHATTGVTRCNNIVSYVRCYNLANVLGAAT